MKKILIHALFFVMLLTSCRQDGGGPGSGEPAPQSGGQNEPAPTATEKLTPDLPEADYNGHEFKIMVTSDEGVAPYERRFCLFLASPDLWVKWSFAKRVPHKFYGRRKSPFR